MFVAMRCLRQGHKPDFFGGYFCHELGKHPTRIQRFFTTFDLIYRTTRSKEPLYPLCLKVLREHKPRSVLDCACGQGGPAIAMRQQGVSVIGTDISKELIKLARQNARAEGVSIPFKVAAWHELPAKINRKFDFVMCHGNAIGHCRGEGMMLRALKGMREVTKTGGYLYVDTVSWEYLRTKRPKYRPGPSARTPMANISLFSELQYPESGLNPTSVNPYTSSRKEEM